MPTSHHVQVILCKNESYLRLGTKDMVNREVVRAVRFWPGGNPRLEQRNCCSANGKPHASLSACEKTWNRCTRLTLLSGWVGRICSDVCDIRTFAQIRTARDCAVGTQLNTPSSLATASPCHRFLIRGAYTRIFRLLTNNGLVGIVHKPGSICRWRFEGDFGLFIVNHSTEFRQCRSGAVR